MTAQPDSRQSAQSLLPRWANGQDSWTRAIAANILKNRVQSAESDGDRYLKFLLAEKKLSDEVFEAIGGFVRVLKRAAGVRSAEEVLPNVRAGKRVPPSATFNVKVGAAAKTVEWKNEFGVVPLNRTSIFVGYLPRKLSTAGAPPGIDPAPGDLAYYAPWGNLAIFYKDAGYARGLIKLGRPDSGAEALSVRGSLKATIAPAK